MKLMVVRHTQTRTPNPNTGETAFVMLNDNETVISSEQFDGQLFLLIAHTGEPVEIPEGFMDAPGHVDVSKAPEWVDLDIHGDIEHFEGETQIQAFIRQWDQRSAS